MNVSMRLRMIPLVLAAAVSVSMGTVRATVEDCVPEDAFALVKVNELAAQFDRLWSSPQIKKLTAADPFAAAVQRIRDGLETFERKHNVDVDAALRETVGGEFALALFPGNTGVFVARGRNARALRSAVEAILRVEKEEGKLARLTTSDYKGVTIYCSSLRGKERFHALMDEVLAVNESLSAVQRVVDVVKGDAPALSASDRYREAAALMTEGALVNAYLDTTHLRPLAQALQSPQMLQNLPPKLRNAGARFMLTCLGELLPLTRSAVLSLTVEGGLRARLTVSYAGGRLPTILKSVLPARGSALDILKLAPASAAFVGARNLNYEAVWDEFAEKVLKGPAEQGRGVERKLQNLIGVLGGIHSERDFFEELGGQTALFVLPGQAAQDPPAVAVAVELRETAHIPVALETVMGMIAAFSDARPDVEASVEYATYRGTDLTTVRIAGPAPWAQLSPTLCVVDSNLVVTSSLGAARQIIDAYQGGTGIAPAGLEGTQFARARVDLRQVRAILDRHSDFLVRHAVKKEGKSEAQAKKDLAALRALLSLFDGVEAVSAFRPGRTDHVLSVQFAGERP